MHIDNGMEEEPQVRAGRTITAVPCNSRRVKISYRSSGICVSSKRRAGTPANDCRLRDANKIRSSFVARPGA